LQKVSGQKHLYIRGGIYYFRVGIPVRYREFFQKAEIRESLQTSNLRHATSKVCEKIVDYNSKLEMIDEELQRVVKSSPLHVRTNPSMDEIRRIVRAWFFEYMETADIRRRAKKIDYDEVKAEEEFKVNQLKEATAKIEPIPLYTTWQIDRLIEKHNLDLTNNLEIKELLTDLVLQGQTEIARRNVDELNGEIGRTYNSDLFSREKFEQDQLKERCILTLGDLIKKFQQDPKHSWTARTRQDYEHQHKVIEEFFGEDTIAADIERDDCRAFQEIIQQYPCNATKKYQDMPLKQMLKVNKNKGGKLLSITSQNKYLETLSSIMRWGVIEQLIPKNPAIGLAIADPDPNPKKEKFTFEELKVMFRSPLFTGCKDDKRGFNTPGPNVIKRSRYWLPLLGLFTGARLNELAQLDCADVREVEGILTFDLNIESEDKSLKTPSSKRNVPVHPELIKMGFKNYVESIASSGSIKLFPELSNAQTGYYSYKASKRFANWLKAIGVKRPEVDNRSFRHGYEAALRKANIHPDAHDALCGWKPTRTSARYGGAYPIEVLNDYMKQVSYPGLDLSHLYEE